MKIPSKIERLKMLERGCLKQVETLNDNKQIKAHIRKSVKKAIAKVKAEK